jgi:photosystem II stability/assembly factor-like uncharacterized protein
MSNKVFMSNRILKLLVIFGVLTFFTSACSLTTISGGVQKTSNAGSNDSVFFSVNTGDSWHPLNSVPSINGRTLNLNGLNVKSLRADPNDSQAVYLASFDRGLYYTYNINQGWNQVSGLSALKINDVQVDPQSKCIIYVASTNNLYRSSDCARTWARIYVDNNSSVNINTIAIDKFNSRNVYIGTSRGEIIKSIDFGNSWRTINTLKNDLAKIVISPSNSSLLFVATKNNKIFSFVSNSRTNSADSSNVDQNFSIDNWTDLNSVLTAYDVGSNFRDIIISPQNDNIFLATDKMILRSLDNGLSWEKIKLTQSGDQGSIKAIAVNPQNFKDLYYVSDHAFFKSNDAGVSWKVQSLPAGRRGQTLLIDAKNPNNIYLGTIKAEK